MSQFDSFVSPAVSVVVTSFKRVSLLSETINSILHQTFTDFELIIVDNVSKDGTAEYVLALNDPRVRFFENPNNGIIAVNRNFGIEKARGKLVALCDDDDLWLPNKLEQQVNLMKANPEVALCYTNAESFSDGGVVKRRMVGRSVHKNHFKQLLRGNYIPNSSVLVDMKVFQELGGLTVNPNLREDYHMWIRVAKIYGIKGIDEPLIRYRIHLTNVAGNKAAETLKAIRTLRVALFQTDVTWLMVQLNIGFQYLKYMIYRMLNR